MEKNAIDNALQFAPKTELLATQSEELFELLSSIVKILNYLKELDEKSKLDDGYIEVSGNDILGKVRNYKDLYQYTITNNPILKIDIDRFLSEVIRLFQEKQK